MSMDNIKTRVITAQLTKADFLKLTAALHKRGDMNTPWWPRVEPFVAAGVGMAGGYAGAFALGAETALAIAVGVCAALVLTFWAASRSRRRQLKGLLRPDGAFLRPFHVSADQTGVTMENEVSSTRVKWEGVFAIDATPDMILLFIDKANAMAIPKAAFADVTAMNAFADELRFLKRRASEAWSRGKEAAA
ncbi:MAG: YcxB family protein [Hyphomonadaceae bacterium]|nr:YcxB family protein [Hyphomonadaceae bacterium]